MYKISRNFLLIVTIATATSSNIQAKDISYDYIQGFYGDVTDSSLNMDIDATSNGIEGSLGISSNIALTASYSAITYDRLEGINIIGNDFTFGVTMHFNISTNTDIAGNFSVLISDIEISDGFNTYSNDDTGSSLDLSIRHKASDTIEIDAGLTYVDVYDDTSIGYDFGLRIYPSSNFSLGIGYDTGDDVDAFIISARIEM